jgi:hypothetical protein
MNGRYTAEPRYLGKLQPYEAESPTQNQRKGPDRLLKRGLATYMYIFIISSELYRNAGDSLLRTTKLKLLCLFHPVD